MPDLKIDNSVPPAATVQPINRVAATTNDPPPAVTVDPVVAALRSEVASLQKDNLALQSRLNATSVRPSTPEDFAAALQLSVDKLQVQLASMTNAVSNFAVKEFRLETNVQIAVTPLGTVEYRFVAADEKPDPGTLSRLSLQLVPIPKQTAVHTYTTDFQPLASLSTIEGITADQQALLHKNGIDTLSDFLSVGTRARSNVELAALLQTDRVKLAGFLISAQLLTLKGIDGPRAAVMSAAGIDSLESLAALSPDDLVKRFNDARLKTNRSDAQPLDVATATRLIAGAKSFVGSKTA